MGTVFSGSGGVSGTDSPGSQPPLFMVGMLSAALWLAFPRSLAAQWRGAMLGGPTLLQLWKKVRGVS